MATRPVALSPPSPLPFRRPAAISHQLHRSRPLPLPLCRSSNKKKEASFTDRILDYIEGGPKLRKWYGAPDLLPKDGASEVEEDRYSEIGTRDAVLVTDGESEIGQVIGGIGVRRSSKDAEGSLGTMMMWQSHVSPREPSQLSTMSAYRHGFRDGTIQRCHPFRHGYHDGTVNCCHGFRDGLRLPQSSSSSKIIHNGVRFSSKSPSTPSAYTVTCLSRLQDLQTKLSAPTKPPLSSLRTSQKAMLSVTSPERRPDMHEFYYYGIEHASNGGRQL